MSPGNLRQRLGTATLVTSTPLIPAAMKVLFPGRVPAGVSAPSFAEVKGYFLETRARRSITALEIGSQTHSQNEFALHLTSTSKKPCDFDGKLAVELI